ncbi:MAG: riboflavin biosynthesis protein RibF [Anaerolineae bacterium]
MQPRIVHWSGERTEIAPASVVTIGVFDSLHLGHQALIAAAVTAAAGLGVPCVCVTFFPSPEVVFGRAEARYLLLPEERAEILGQLGVDTVVVTRFDRDLAALEAADFMALLRDVLRPVQVWIGDDFALGRGRLGDAARLAALGEALGYQLAVVPRVRVDGDVVSSSLIRSLLRRGDVERAAAMLGRPYRLTGNVKHGFGVGKGLGFPTANLDVPAEKELPADGVYAALAELDGRCWPAALSIGVRPTFGGSARTVEAFLIGFDGDLYGRRLTVSVVARLRDEMRFPSPEALKEQMRADARQTEAVLAETGVCEGVPQWVTRRSHTQPT